MTEPVVEARGLTRRIGKVQALDYVDSMVPGFVVGV